MSTTLGYVKTILEQMVAIDSQSSNENHEEITHYMTSLLENDLGLIVEVVPYSKNPHKHNIIAYKRLGFKVVLCGHLDTVNIGSGWTKEPLKCTTEVVDDKTYIYGRGTSDMKGGNAVIIATLKRLIENNNNIDDIAIFFSTEEEVGVRGCQDFMVSHRHMFESVETFVVLEPTNLYVGSGQNGHYWVKYTCHGKSAHGCMPQDGLNAIDGMADLNCVLKEAITAPDLNGHVILNIGTHLEEIIKQTIDQMNEISYAQYEYEFISKISAIKCRSTNVLLNKLSEYMKSINQFKEVSLPYGSDAAVFKKEFPSSDFIIFGPGTVEQMHKTDEFVVLEHLNIAIEALVTALKGR
ncbi:acetylornithine deacetylase [Entamoeba histolytica HM-3:IMSS]|uniref:Acetylornithine deacetylase n=1 Tax=Entamoeba histolytica HM-3:IMSS TaxID=885315 RepID=M7WI46_ENTHI|nr:acetylornithine deacetylase [Entamoeba histolytica HM-3:IMSS]